MFIYNFNEYVAPVVSHTIYINVIAYLIFIVYHIIFIDKVTDKLIYICKTGSSVAFPIYSHSVHIIYLIHTSLYF